MHVAPAIVYRLKSEIGLSQNPSLTSQKVFGAFLIGKRKGDERIFSLTVDLFMD